jgi:hypothetical protein
MGYARTLIFLQAGMAAYVPALLNSRIKLNCPRNYLSDRCNEGEFRQCHAGNAPACKLGFNTIGSSPREIGECAASCAELR